MTIRCCCFCLFVTGCHTEQQIKLTISPSHSVLTPGKPALELTRKATHLAEQPLVNDWIVEI